MTIQTVMAWTPLTMTMPADMAVESRAWKALLNARDYSALLCATGAVLTEGGPEAFLYHGKALEGLLQMAEAADCYRRGLERFADAARLHLAQGQLALRGGRREQALESLQRARALAPDLLDCYAALLHLQPLDPDGAEATRILARALDDRRSEAARSRALFLLGQLHVEAGRDRPGFAFYRQGNRMAARAFTRRQREYRISRSVLRVGNGGFTPPSTEVPSCPALVVAGLPRSGKSLVEAVLAEHPEVAAGGEFAGLRAALGGLPDASAEALQEQGATGRSPFAEAYARHPLAAGGARWIVDTSPTNLVRLHYLAHLHPEVPVVLCRRRAADLGLALYFKKFRNGQGYSYGLASTGRAIAAAERLIEHWQAVLPNPVLVVDYEVLVSDPEATRTRLFGHLGLAPPPARARAAAAGDWRLYPSKSPGAGTALEPHLIGFADRFRTELEPLVRAYDAVRVRGG
jgi:tetratricopeptide (TPR) repeat protein